MGRRTDETRGVRLGYYCPEHGKADMIAWSADAMWHPSTGEPWPGNEITYACIKVIKQRRFLLWKWDVRCKFKATRRPNEPGNHDGL